jgi:hypothetical protein
MTAFDESLWERLVAEHDADRVSLTPAHDHARRRPLLLGGGVAVLAGVATAAVVALNAATSASPAYALTVRADGSVSITVHELASAIPQLNAEFARRGINETVVPVTAKCRPSREFRLQAYPTAHMTDTWTFTPAYSARTPGWKGVLAAEQLPNGEVAVAQMVVPEPVPSCFSNAAYTLRLTGKTNHGVPMATETRVFPATPAHAGG